MKIGIFDSGLGGLLIAKAVRKAMPQYDYVYLGDTKRVPYGGRSHATILEFTRSAVRYLFETEDCYIVIVACNTASAQAVKELKKEMPEKIIFGVIFPAVEKTMTSKKVGVMATSATVSSNAFGEEIKRVNSKTKVFQNAAPMLVPLVEEGEHKHAIPFIKKYLKPLLDKKIDTLILGCTHYPYFKKEIRALVPKSVQVVSQDEIIPKKLQDYLSEHPEISKMLSKNGRAKILVTDKTKELELLAQKWFGKNSKIELIELR